MPIRITAALRSALASLAATASLAVALTACSASDRPAESDTNTDTAGSPGSSELSQSPTPLGKRSTWALPIEAYLPNQEQSKSIQTALFRLAEKCMEDQGFTVDLGEPRTGLNDLLGSRYGTAADPEIATKFGYHSPDTVRQSGSKGREEEPPELSEEAVEALYGNEDERLEAWKKSGADHSPYLGCMGEAEKQIAGDTDFDTMMLYENTPVQEIQSAAWAVLQKDPYVQAARQAWAECMAEEGYRTIDEKGMPILDFESLGIDLDAPKPSQTEIDLATWDVHCQQETKVAETSFRVESQFQEAEIGKRAEALAQVKKTYEEAVRNAATVLAQG